MKTLAISLLQARRAFEILHDVRLDREILQVSSASYAFSDNEDGDLEASISDALTQGGINEFEIF